MHDIDSTRLELSPEYEDQEQEMESYSGEFEAEMPITEAEEEELATELLGVSDEAEMDQFLGRVFRKVRQRIGSAAGKFLAKNAGPLAGALKNLAGNNLPFLGGLLGTAIPIPGLGTALGSAVGKAASQVLQSELGELEAEDQEYEIAKRFVRLATNSFRQAARRRLASPIAAAGLALRNAVRNLSQQYRIQPVYRSCPPCPPCPQPPPPPAYMASEPTATEPVADGGMAGGEGNSGAGASQLATPAAENPEYEFTYAGPAGSQGEFEPEFNGEWETDGEFGANGEFYETNYEAPAVPSGGNRSGRWVRRGRKIILYGL